MTLADPASRWSFLNYLKTGTGSSPSTSPSASTSSAPNTTPTAAGSADALPGTPLRPPGRRRPLEPRTRRLRSRLHPPRPDGETEALGRTHARNLVLGIGTAPHVPEPLRPLPTPPAVPGDPLRRLPRPPRTGSWPPTTSPSSAPDSPAPRSSSTCCAPARPAANDSTGSPAPPPSRPWSTPNSAWNTSPPTTPATSTPSPNRSATGCCPASGSSTKASTPTPSPPSTTSSTAAPCDGGWPDAVLTPGVTVRTAGRVGTTKIELHLEHTQQGTRSRLTTDAVVLATGYRERPLDRLLARSTPTCAATPPAGPAIDDHYRLDLDPAVTGRHLRPERRTPHPRRRRPRPRTRRLAQRHHPQRPHRPDRQGALPPAGQDRLHHLRPAGRPGRGGDRRSRRSRRSRSRRRDPLLGAH